jgi:hypothetical protein
VISRPTTEQVLLDCCRVLEHDVLPGLSDETMQVRVVMLGKVLRNAAVRAAHEVAWMREETAQIEAYARGVAAATGSDGLRAAVDELGTGPHGSLHLADVVEVYVRASEALSLTLEVALAAERNDLVREGEALLSARLAHENDVVGGWDAAGR